MGPKAVNIPSLICSCFSKSISQNQQEGFCQPLRAFGWCTIEICRSQSGCHNDAEMHPTDGLMVVTVQDLEGYTNHTKG